MQRVDLSEAPALLKLSHETFFTAFYDLNNPADMEAYAAKAFTLERISEEIETPGSVFYFAIVENDIAGFLKLNTAQAQNEFQDQNGLEVERLYVKAAFQRRKIGEQMLTFAHEQAIMLQCDFIWLGVWEYNQKAIRLYKRLGFVQCGSHDFMLGSDRQTYLLFRKPL
jgi:diamine N-acetyltransferase